MNWLQETREVQYKWSRRSPGKQEDVGSIWNGKGSSGFVPLRKATAGPALQWSQVNSALVVSVTCLDGGFENEYNPNTKSSVCLYFTKSTGWFINRQNVCDVILVEKFA
ncbi:hypothetical protein M8J77_022132 [Diaphorina citri]|nr:hypothetical protein M8J77_022132 [Diaphorina citri]